MTTPVNNAVETPAGPHEKPFDFRTTFCSFLLLPAQTNVIGYVTFSYSDNSSFKVIFSGFATSLSQLLVGVADRGQSYLPFDRKLPIRYVLVLNYWHGTVIPDVE